MLFSFSVPLKPSRKRGTFRNLQTQPWGQSANGDATQPRIYGCCSKFCKKTSHTPWENSGFHCYPLAVVLRTKVYPWNGWLCAGPLKTDPNRTTRHRSGMDSISSDATHRPGAAMAHRPRDPSPPHSGLGKKNDKQHLRCSSQPNP